MNSIATLRAATSSASSEALERALLRRISMRDRGAMRELYLLYHRRLARFLRRLTLRTDLIDEIINDTMMIVWQCAQTYRAEARVSTWIMGIAYRHGLKSLRLEHRHESTDEPGADLCAPATGGADEQRDLVQKALATLSLDHRLVIEFTYYAGHSCEEIATIMECPTNTVKTRLFYAREKLRTLLPELGGGGV